jgi:polyphosphate kinase 2
VKRSRFKRLAWPLNVELIKLQRWVAERGQRLLVIVEGRDAAGKTGLIRRLTRHLDPRAVRAVALPRPTDLERGQWYFQRYLAQLPGPGEIVFFDRSYYNRAGLERVFGFCSEAEAEAFLAEAPRVEGLLVGDGIHVVKLYLTIAREEQARRLERRLANPLKRWKLSELDRQAQARWDDMAAAEAEMLARTSSVAAPWTLVRSDDKRLATVNVMRALLRPHAYPGKEPALLELDPGVLCPYAEAQP